MAHKKGVGSSRNGRNSNPQYLGVKLFGGEKVTAGAILVKQRGTKFHVGKNVFKAKDDSLHSYIDGIVKFEQVAHRRHVRRGDVMQDAVAQVNQRRSIDCLEPCAADEGPCGERFRLQAHASLPSCLPRRHG